MPRDRAAQFEVKNSYDALIARGPNVRWPAGMLPGLRAGIRAAQFMLKNHFGPAKQNELVKRLRAAAESAINDLDATDAVKLGTIIRRGRTRSEAEFHLVRSAIDRLEGDRTADREYLERLWVISDRANAK